MKLLIVIIIRTAAYLDYLFRSFAKIFVRHPFKRVGSCKQCGECCRYILFAVDRRMLAMPKAKRFIIWWNQYFNDLIFIEELPEKAYLAFTCKHLGANGRCQNYSKLRPLFCYEYPRTYGYFEEPTTLPKCGYHFEWRS